MATSSFSKNFVIDDPDAVEQLIQAMENPTQITLSPRRSEEQEQKDIEDFLCAAKKQLASQKSSVR